MKTNQGGIFAGLNIKSLNNSVAKKLLLVLLTSSSIIAYADVACPLTREDVRPVLSKNKINSGTASITINYSKDKEAIAKSCEGLIKSKVKEAVVHLKLVDGTHALSVS